MSNLVVVAIPDENDRVWKVSSEKIPHLTLLFLGEADQVSNVQSIIEFVEHAASTTLRRFYLPVDRRDELGSDKADTLIFKKGRYDYKAIRDFRMFLLKDDNIRKAYDAAPQHDGPWLPHLTLGYPDSPAKSDDTDRDFGFYDVAFNKIAVWTGDFDGPDFLLKDPWDEWETMEAAPLDVAWGDISEAGEEFMLEHYGVKGMKWGVRKADRSEEGARSLFDPTGRSVKADLAENFVAGVVFFPLAVPSSVRLYRGAYRGAKAKAQDISEKRDDKKFEKVAQSQKAFVAIHNGAHERLNGDIDKINKKYTDADMAVPAKKKKYDAEVLKAMQDAYKESANQIGNRRGTKHLDVEFRNDGMDFAIKVRDGAQTPTVEKVKHAAIDDDDVVTFEGKIKRDAVGYIVGFAFDDFQPDMPNDSVAQAAEDGAEFLVHMGLMSIEDFLEHFGVKGMRWGVRKEDVSAVGRAAKSAGGKVGKAATAAGKFVGDVNFESKLDSPEGKQKVQHEIHKKAKEAFKRTDLPAIKDKPEYQEAKKLKNRLFNPRDAATKAYRKEVKAAYIKRLEDAANSMTNASGTRQYTIRERGWELPAEGGALPKSKHYWDVSTREVKHAADGDVTISVEVTLDDYGFVTDINPISPEDAIAQSMDLGADFLEHYGVKGMRWGVRNADRPAPTAVDAVAKSVVPHGAKRKTKIEVEGGENHEAHPDAIKVAEAQTKLKKSGTAALSNAELQQVAKRLQLESQVAQLSSNRAQKFIQRQLEQQGQQAVQVGVRKGGAKVVKKGVKKAGKAAATGAVTLALL